MNRTPLGPTLARSILLLSWSFVALLFNTRAHAQTSGADRCASASEEATRITERCHATTPSPETSREAFERQQEDCAARGLEELLAWCPESNWVRLNLGITEANRRNWVHALELLREALVSHDPLVDAARPEVERQVMPLVRRNVAWVAPTVEVRGATLRVNGRPAGTLPLLRAVVVLPGEVTLNVRAPGFRDATTTVRLAGGEEFIRPIPLERLPEPASSAGAAPWVITGVGAATLIASGVLFWQMNDALDTRDANCDAVAQACYPEAQDAQEQAEALRVGAVTTLAVGGAALVSGVIWGIASWQRERSGQRTAWSIGAHPWREGVHLVFTGSL